MSEQEDNSRHKVSGESSVVVVKAQASERIKSYRPNELENEPGERHKYPKAPPVPSVTEEIKEAVQNIQSSLPADTTHGEKPERKKQDHVPRGQVSRMFAAVAPGQEDMKGAESVALTNLQKDPGLKVIPSPAAPIDIKPVPTRDSVKAGKDDERADEDSITDEVAELPTTVDWTDEQEAGGLPRSESRTSRTSRVSKIVRHFLCCSATYAPASEDDITSARDYGI